MQRAILGVLLMTGIIWSGGWKWAPSDSEAVWQPDGASPSGKAAPTVAIAGSWINNQVQSASWGIGPSDYLADLAPGQATIAFVGAVDAEPDDDVVIFTEWGSLFSGRVVSVSERTDVNGDVWTTIVATDRVGQMGMAKLRKDNGKTGDLVEIIEYLGRRAGVKVTVEDVSVGTYGLPQLQRYAYFGETFTGSMLDYLNNAARSSNAMVALQPDGTLRVMTREALPSAPTAVALSGDNSPASWTKTLEWGNDVNKWTYTTPGGAWDDEQTKVEDIRAHGERTFDVPEFLDVGDPLTGLSISEAFYDWWDYTPSARWTASGEFVVDDLAQEELLTLRPLDWIEVEGDTWQVMSMSWSVPAPGQPMRLTITADDFLARL